jgi:hypothetical protein
MSALRLRGLQPLVGALTRGALLCEMLARFSRLNGWTPWRADTHRQTKLKNNGSLVSTGKQKLELSGALTYRDHQVWINYGVY